MIAPPWSPCEDGSRDDPQRLAAGGRDAAPSRQAGIVPGDRIGAVMPNTWETLVAMLAASSLRGSVVKLLSDSAPASSTASGRSRRNC
jgi:acyl-CoA synthetase (AMP-forming)/AMP-acid ligase II